MARRFKAPEWTPNLFALVEQPPEEPAPAPTPARGEGAPSAVLWRCATCGAGSYPKATDEGRCPWCRAVKPVEAPMLDAADLHAIGLHRTSLPPHTLMVLRTQANVTTVGDLVALAGRRGVGVADAVRQVTTRPGWLPETPEDVQRAVEWWVKEVASGR